MRKFIKNKTNLEMLNIDRVEAVRKVPARMNGKQCYAVAVSNETKVTGHIVAAFTDESKAYDCLEDVQLFWADPNTNKGILFGEGENTYRVLEVKDEIEESLIHIAEGNSKTVSIKR